MHPDLTYVRTELRTRNSAPGRSHRIGDRFRFRTDGLVNRMALAPARDAREGIVRRTAAHLIATSKGIS
jgi:hypothetical protein